MPTGPLITGIPVIYLPGNRNDETISAISSRLTALTVHALSSITLQRYFDPDLLKSALTWMHGQQNDDGSFADGPNVTQSQRIETTAFILTCLSDVQHDDIVRDLLVHFYSIDL
jgi:hypothetical protein